VTNVEGPSSGDRLPPTWLIVTGIVAALALVFLLGAGAGQEWGAEQWGPVAAWFAGAATVAAVVVALRQANIAQRQARLAQRDSKRSQLDRLIDHEVSRRRECIKAFSDLWAAIVAVAIEFSSFNDYLINLPEHSAGTKPRTDILPERPGESLAEEVGRRYVGFYERWAGAIQPLLFVALAILHDTEVYDAVVKINNDIAKMSKEDTEGGFADVRNQIFPDVRQDMVYRPDTRQLKYMWHDISGRRDQHLRLMQLHFSLNRKNVERYVLENLTR
jgi:hypothetical protein